MADVMLRLKVTADGQGNLTATAQGLEKVEKQAKQTQSSLDGLSKQFKDGLGLGAGMLSINAAIGGIKAVANEFKAAADWAEKLGKATRSSGLDARTFQQMAISAENLGFSMENVSSAAAKMQRNVASNSEAFQKLGLSTKDLKQLNPEEMFRQVASAISSIEDPTERAAAAMEVYGKSGAEMIPLLDEIASGAYEVNKALGDDQVEALSKADAALDRSAQAWKNWKLSALAAIAPVFDYLTKPVLIGGGQVRGGGVGGLAGGFGELAHISDPRTYLQTNGLTLGPEEEETKKRVASIEKASVDRNREIKKLLDEQTKSAEKLGLQLLKNMLNASPSKMAYGIGGVVDLGPTKNATWYGMSGDQVNTFGGETFGKAALDATVRTKEATIDWNQELQKAANIMISMGGSLGSIGQAMAQLSGGISGVMSGIDSFKTGQKTGGIEGFLGKAGGVLSIAASAFSIGKTIASALGIGGNKKIMELNKTRDSYLESQGGYEELSKKLSSLTNKDMVKQIFDAKTVEDFNKAVSETNRLLGLQDEAQSALNSAMEKYGITVSELGPAFRQQELDKSAAALLKDFELLSAAGVDVAVVLDKMGVNLTEYINTAVTSGSTVPEAMRKMVEEAIKNGEILDANGEAYKSVEDAGVSFAQTMTEQFDSLITKIGELVDALLGIPSSRTVTINTENGNVDRGGDYWDGSRGDLGEGRARGLKPKKLDKDTVFLAHAGELVMVVPKSLAGKSAFKSAARGYGDGEDPTRGRGGADPSSSGAYTPQESPVLTPTGGSSGSTQSSTAEVVAAVREAVAQATSINVNNNPQVTIVDQSAVKTAEGQRAFGRYVVAEVERALDQNARGLKTKIESIARQAAR
jgi:hypothetical protein